MQSVIKRSLLAVVMLFVGLLVGLLSRNAMSQHASNSAASSEVGGYQLFPCGNSPDPNVYFLDTKTGRTWLKGSSTGNAWVEDTPPIPKSK